MGNHSRRNRLRADIEGLRGIAVLTVVAFHLGLPGVSGGFAGVDVFFVISGFLITGLLVREVAETGWISILNFYARRARRLLPAASLVIGFTLVFGWMVLPGAQRPDLATDAVAATLYVINWALAARAVDYLAEDAAASPLQHYWSLAVEEQYYLVWPLLVLGVLLVAERYRLSAGRLLVLFMWLVVLASGTYALVHTASSSSTAYFVTGTRAWELAVGSLLAMVQPSLARLSKWAASRMAVSGLLMVLLAMVWFSADTAWPGVAAWLPVLGTALVIGAGTPYSNNPVARLLGWSPLTWIGGLSYAIYLWHWPLLVLAEARWPQMAWWGRVGLAVTTVGLAWLTKVLVEDPIRFDRTLAARPRGAVALALVAMSATTVLAVGLRASLPTLRPQVPVAGAAALVADPSSVSWRPLAAPESAITRSGRLTPLPALAPQDSPGYYAKDCQAYAKSERVRSGCQFGDRTAKRSISLLGDSKMGQWFTALNDIAIREGYRLDLYLKSGCAATTAGEYPACNEFGKAVRRALAGAQRPAIAVVSGLPPTNAAAQAGVTAQIKYLRSLGTRVVVLAGTPGAPDLRYVCAEKSAENLAACEFPRTWPQGVDPLERAAQDAGARFVTLNEWICPLGRATCPVAIGGTLIYRQGSHLTDSYVRTLSPMLHRALISVGVFPTSTDKVTLSQIPAGTASWGR